MALTAPTSARPMIWGRSSFMTLPMSLIWVALVFSIAAWIVLGLWFAVQLYNGVTATDDGVAYLAHIGGYIAGLVLTVPVFLRRGGTGFWTQNAGHPPHAAAEYSVSPTNIPRVRRL